MNKFHTILVALFIVATSFAQTPEQMGYQAIVRDATGSLVTNQQVGMQISILQTTVGGTAVYVETQTPTTNANGLVSIAIGTGTPVNGTFATIDWSADTYFIKTETDPTGSTSYSIIGTSQLLSVPYALHAKTATTAITAANGIPAGGTQDQVLQIVAGVPTWIDASFNVFYKDIDGDSYGDINSIIATSGAAPNGYVTNNTDCNDSDPAINPATVWYADLDGDGYGDATSSETGCTSTLTNATLDNTDCSDSDPAINPTTVVWYADLDGDGYGDATSSETGCTSTLTNATQDNTDCNDGDPNINPTTVWYADLDGDGYGDATSSETGCTSTLTNTTQDNTDCNDNDPNINPTTVWYADLDGDGYGDATSSETGCTSTLTNATQDNTDCNDGDPNINPTTVWYADLDGDGYGDATSSETGCTSTLTNATQDNTDCNDNDPNINPTTLWYADLDGDGDGYFGSTTSVIACENPGAGYSTTPQTISDCDDTDPLVNNVIQTWYIDADSDGYGGSSIDACARPSDGFLLSELSGSGTDDCNDGNPAIHPGHLEIAGDDIDNNCDGTRDELAIGQFIEGGIVFWIDPADNNHVLVCAQEDQSAGIQWYNGLNKYITFTETAIRTGASNTKIITDYQGPTATNYAAGIAKAYTNGPFSDWFLPSKDALNEMYLNKTAINAALTTIGGTVLSGSYWSSSEVNSELAWGQSLTDGSQGNYVKYFGGKVRAVRELNYIGKIIDNGVVFYLAGNATTDLDGDGFPDQGLICAMRDYYAAWGCYGTDLTNVPNVAFNGGNPVVLGAEIGDGRSNTTYILIDCPTAPAALAARSFGLDWFLPSIKELHEMYLNKATLELVPGFMPFPFYNKTFWSSTEVDSSYAWEQNFASGNTYSFIPKDRIDGVRAVRAF